MTDERWAVAEFQSRVQRWSVEDLRAKLDSLKSDNPRNPMLRAIRDFGIGTVEQELRRRNVIVDPEEC